MNRKPYNRSGFNRSSVVTTNATGFASLKLRADPVFANRTISAVAIPARLSLSGTAIATVVKSASGNAAMKVNALAMSTRALYALPGAATMALKAAAEQSVQGESVIDLQGLVLEPGDEMVINTEDMTVTINGQNAMDYFTMDSEFFALLNGENTIVYADENVSRTANLDIIWKDRWL